MISFVVIGRNEAKKLKRCFDSIYETIYHNFLNEYEIIFVDSNSTDNSRDTAAQFKEIRVFVITGECNAAIGRNIGAREANGDVLYFIDADMEICKDFVAEVLDDDKKLKYHVVSGIITDVEDNVIKINRFSGYKNFLPNNAKPLDGGIFLIKKNIWQSVRGMRTKFINGEDGDLGLRLAQKGFTFARLNKTIAFHHTVNYLDSSRMWHMVLSRSVFYSNCVLYRDHLLNKYVYRRIWEQDKTFIFLIFILGCIFFVPAIFLSLLIFAYLVLIFFRAWRQRKKVLLISLFSYYMVVDLLNFIFFFTFFPRNKRLEYIAINR